MWYWNQDNFEGLVAITQRIAHETTWSRFAEYCRLRERGLRKNAFAELTAFISETKLWSTTERRRFVDWIFVTQLRFVNVSHLISTPLNLELLVPTLQEWRESESSDPTPLRWLGIATFDHTYFAEALALDPSDDYSRFRLVSEYVGDVDHQCHHLPDYFIGDPKDALRLLQQARETAAEFADIENAQMFDDEIRTLAAKVEDWIEFKRTESDSFSEWCKQKGRHYKWYMAIYYKR